MSKPSSHARRLKSRPRESGGAETATAGENGRIVKSGSYLRVLNEIFDLPSSTLAKLVLMNLCRRANSNGESFPSHKTIARDCSCSERSVQYALAELARHKLVTIKIRKQQGLSNLYRLSMFLRPPTHGSEGYASAAYPSASAAYPSASAAYPPTHHVRTKEDPVEGKHKKEEERGFFLTKKGNGSNPKRHFRID